MPLNNIVDPVEDLVKDPTDDPNATDNNPNTPPIPEFGGGPGVADARATGTGPGPKAEAPTSSGSFKDFSKFQAANKEKVANQSNEVVSDANNRFTSGKQGIETAVTGARTGITGQTKDASQFNNVSFNNISQDVDKIKGFQGTTFDAEGAARQAAENISKGVNDYTSLVDPVLGTSNVAGVRNFLASKNPEVSSVATGGDALLLRSNQNAREGLRGAQNAIKGYDANAAKQQGLADVNQAVQDTVTANQAADNQLKAILDNVRAQGEGELNTKVAKRQDQVYQQAIAKIIAEAGKYGQNFKDVGPMQRTKAQDDKDLAAVMSGQTWAPGSPVEYEKEIYQNRFFNNLTEDQIVESAGGYGKLRELLGIPNSVKGANVLAEDARLRAGFEALNNLGLGSKLYNPQATKASQIQGAGLGSAGFNELRDKLTEASKSEAATKAGSKAAHKEIDEMLNRRKNTAKSDDPFSTFVLPWA